MNKEHHENPSKMVNYYDYDYQRDCVQNDLLFYGIKDQVRAISYTLNKVVAKFKVRGDVIDLKVTKDNSYLLVISNAGGTQYIYKFLLKNIEFEQFPCDGKTTHVKLSNKDQNMIYIVRNCCQLQMYNVL